MTTAPVPEKLFARKATGLVREIGFLTAILIVLANTIGLGWQKRVFQFSGKAPVPENAWPAGIPPMTTAFIIGGIVVLFSIVAYAVLAAAMPRSGGGYVVISRILGPFTGFVASWAEFLSISWSFGIIAVAVFEAIWFIFGPLAGISAPAGTTAVTLALGGLGIVVLFTIIASFGVRLTGSLLQVMFWVPAALTVYIYYLLASGAANPALVSAGLQSFTGHPPADFVNEALAQGMAAHATDYYTGVSVALLGAYWAYIGYAASTFVAGEVKEANRTLPRTLLIGGVIIITVYLSVSYLAATASRIGVTSDGQWSFFSACSYLSYGAGDISKISGAVPCWTSTIAAYSNIGLGLGSLNVLILVFAVFWVANDIPPFILTASRIVFAMSFDRVFPSTLANVNERFHSPVNAVLFAGGIALMGVASESGVFAKTPVLGDLFGTGVASTDLLDGIFFTAFAAALVIFPTRRRDIYETAPWKPGGRGTLLTIGIIALVGNLYLDWVFLTAPSDYDLLSIATSSFTQYSIGFTIVLLLVGALIYWGYRGRAKTTGIDYTTIFTQIPPE